MQLPENFELLKYLHEEQRDQLAHRRSRELNIFNWSNAILLGLIGFILSFDLSNYNLILLKYNFSQIIITSIVIGVSIFSIKWQIYQRRCAANHEKQISKLNRLLGCFDGDESLYPKKWKNWGEKNITLGQNLKYPSKLSATILSGIVALISLWIKTILI